MTKAVMIAPIALGLLFAIWRLRPGKQLFERWLFPFWIFLAALPAAYVLLITLELVRESHVRILRPSFAITSLVAMAFVAHRMLVSRLLLGPWRRRLVDLFVSITTLSLSLLVMGVEVGRPIDRLTVIVAIDRSRSIDMVSGAADLITKELALAEEGMREEDGIAIVAFGANANTEQPARQKRDPKSAQEANVSRDGTDLDAALRRALSEVPVDSGARIVLVTDGVATRGDVMSGGAASLAAQVPVDVLPLIQAETAELRVVSVRVPQLGDTGESVDLAVVTKASEETRAEVRIKRDGQLIKKSEVLIPKGEDVLRVREKLGEAGLHRYDVELTPLTDDRDSSPEDNAGSAFVRVRGRASALLIEGDGREAAAFIESALSKSDIVVDVVGGAGVPADLAGFAAYDLVILSDVPASALSTIQISALATYVRDFGGGLLLMGGDRGLGPGGYGKSPIEEVSPVSFDLKQDQRRASLAQVIAIDISGSMAARVGERTKLELANEAASRSAVLLGLNDRLGVEHVDTQVHWTVPLGPVSDSAAIGDAIRSMPVGGGGILVPITLIEGYAALRKEQSNIKHVLLFADGADAEDMPEALPLTTAALADGITTSVVSLGQGGDVPALEEMSRLGKGRFYLIEDATRLPAVFAQETILAARSALYEEPFRVSLASPGAVAASIAWDEAPELLGYVVSIPKPRASIHVTGPESDPVLATWSVGVGRSGVFTSDLKGRWGQAWTTWPGAAKLVVQTSRDLLRRADDEKVRTQATISNGNLHVRSSALGNDGRAANFRRLQAKIVGPDGVEKVIGLDPSGAGSYVASLPVDRPGTYMVLTSDAQTGELLGATGAVMTRGEELRVTGSDEIVLERVAAFTGGVRRSTLEGIYADRPRLRFAYRDITALLVMIAAASLFLMVASRKLGIPEGLVDWIKGTGATATEEAPAASLEKRPVATLNALRSAKQGPKPKPKPKPAPPEPTGAQVPPTDAPTAASPPEPARVRAPQRVVGLHPIAQPAPRPNPQPPLAAPLKQKDTTPDGAPKKASTAELLAAKKRGKPPT